jgi:hypothetical protein
MTNRLNVRLPACKPRDLSAKAFEQKHHFIHRVPDSIFQTTPGTRVTLQVCAAISVPSMVVPCADQWRPTLVARVKTKRFDQYVRPLTARRTS